ncbi:hypothetical protein ACWD3J_43460 [Streptomyces sp. NPDC002755]
MTVAHFVLDTPTLMGLVGGNSQVCSLAHRACLEADARLWVPRLSLVEAEREWPGTIDHVAELRVIHTFDLDYAGAHGVRLLHREGVPIGIAAAIHTTRDLLRDPESDALVATVVPEAYEGSGIRVFYLDR